jgi:hypothetical protein
LAAQPGNLLNALKAGATWSRASEPRFRLWSTAILHPDLPGDVRPKISTFQSNGTDSVGFHASNLGEFVSPMNDVHEDSIVSIVSINRFHRRQDASL